MNEYQLKFAKSTREFDSWYRIYESTQGSANEFASLISRRAFVIEEDDFGMQSPLKPIVAKSNADAIVGAGLIERLGESNIVSVGIWVPRELRHRGIGSAIAEFVRLYVRNSSHVDTVKSSVVTNSTESSRDLLFAVNCGLEEEVRFTQQILEMKVFSEKYASRKDFFGSILPDTFGLSVEEGAFVEKDAKLISQIEDPNLSQSDLKDKTSDLLRRESMLDRTGSFRFTVYVFDIDSVIGYSTGTLTRAGVFNQSMTRVLPGYQKGGLASFMKLFLYRRLSGLERPVRSVVTKVDDTNRPMKSINNNLGFVDHCSISGLRFNLGDGT
ncbi:hypothetical protein [Corynebacterium variabile]|uniref:N-acetyltransferase domain-containing protein n=1 Tax=Corynebacterium variabile TaxID=1727 RepID=A0A110BGE5_9CORY|nr:hypothetical protein [Corynebacterium variabile]CUU65187.1 hypothetical protein CVAR292_00504 [Corynebacterium variabile]